MKNNQNTLRLVGLIVLSAAGLGLGLSFVPTKSAFANILGVIIISAAIGYFVLAKPFVKEGGMNPNKIPIVVISVVLISLALWSLRSRLGVNVAI